MIGELERVQELIPTMFQPLLKPHLNKVREFDNILSSSGILDKLNSHQIVYFLYRRSNTDL